MNQRNTVGCQECEGTGANGFCAEVKEFSRSICNVRIYQATVLLRLRNVLSSPDQHSFCRHSPLRTGLALL